MPGPAPKRSEERMRRNEPETPIIKTGVDDLADSPFAIDFDPSQPPAESDWHPLAKEWWDALGRSPEAMWMTAAGWAVAKIGAEQLSRELKPQFVGVNEVGSAIIETVPMKGASFAAHLRLWSVLGLTEGDRRRMGREVTLHTATRARQSEGKVTSIASRREAAMGGS